MYSHRMGSELTVYRLMGVVAGGGGGAAGEAEAEIHLITRQYLWPLDSMSTAGALRRMNREPDREALLGPRLRVLFAGSMVLLLVGVRLLLGPSFEMLLLCHLFWVPWDRVEGWARRRFGGTMTGASGEVRPAA